MPEISVFNIIIVYAIAGMVLAFYLTKGDYLHSVLDAAFFLGLCIISWPLILICFLIASMQERKRNAHIDTPVRKSK